MTDIDRIDDVVSSEIPEYDDLSPKEKTQALLGTFFGGAEAGWRTNTRVKSSERARFKTYGESARALRDALDYARDTGEYENIRIDSITRRGKRYDIIRDAETGRIKAWVK